MAYGLCFLHVAHDGETELSFQDTPSQNVKWFW